jgi:hypothetical protein
VLSGGDGDGTLGLKVIKERGGLTLAQVPDGHGPEHPAMPQTAISTGLVDFALPAGQMGGRIVEFARSQRLLDHMAKDSRRSSNEKLISVNEELQSTNEELDASKEELQSVNEELHTVNADLNNKVDALDRGNTDLQNLFNSTDVAALFLDRGLRIRSFTPAASRVFNMLPGDRGRPITDLSQRFSLASFGQELGAVMASGQPVERRVDDGSGQVHYLLRMTP